MKNIVFLTVLFSCNTLVCNLAYSQIEIRAGFGVADIGFKFRGQVPYLGTEINSLVHRYPKFSYQGGFSYTFDLGKRFDVKPELLFSMMGMDYSEDLLYDDITHKINIAYLKLPVLVRYKFIVKERKESGIIFGPYLAYNMKAYQISEVEGNREIKEMSNVKDIDFGIIAGYALDYFIPTNKLTIDFRTSFSLINMMDVVDGYIPWYYGPSEEYARNISITMNIGYRFSNIGHKPIKKP